MCYVNALFSFAAVAAAAAAYAARSCPGSSRFARPRAIGAAVIALFAAAELRRREAGRGRGRRVHDREVRVLVVLVARARAGASPRRCIHAELPHGWSGVGTATFVALFAAQGFEVAPVPAGETRAPQRDLPFAIVGSLRRGVAPVRVVQAVLVASGANLSEPSDTPLVDAARSVAPCARVPGRGGRARVDARLRLGQRARHAALSVRSRGRRHLPAALGAVHPRFGSPHIAIVATAAVAIALVVAFDYRSLIGISNVAVAVQYLATCAAVPFLRRRGVPGRRVPGGPIAARSSAPREPVGVHRGFARGAGVGRAPRSRSGSRCSRCARAVIAFRAEDSPCPSS
jgi:hypothetical protein